MVICVCLSVAYSLHVPEVYKAEILLAPAQKEKSGSSAAFSQFGGLAAMAGISIPSNTNVERVLATLESREFLGKFINGKNLLQIIFSDHWDEESNSWKLEDGMSEFVNEDGIRTLLGAIEFKKETTGLITLSVFWTDPVIAADWANDLVLQLNEQLRNRQLPTPKNGLVI